jgi:hypothetical protein
MTELLAVRGIEKTSPGFRAELVRMARRLGLNADAIAGVMALESGFDPAATNPRGGATGLIQFMPGTATNLGTTTDALRRMSATEQLKFVERYFQGRPQLKAGSRAGDYYVTTFMPGFVGMPDLVPIAFRGDGIYDVNKVLDRNADGILTVGDVRSVLESELARASKAPRIPVDENAPSDAATQASVLPTGGDSGSVLFWLAAAAGGWWLWKGQRKGKR